MHLAAVRSRLRSGAKALAAADRRRESPALHILVNNAGATWGAPMAEYPDDAFDKVMNLNVKGIFHLTRFLVPQLGAAGTAEDPARVINIGRWMGCRCPHWRRTPTPAARRPCTT